MISLLPRIKPSFLDQVGIHFATTLTEVVGAHHTEALRASKIVLLITIKF